VFVYFLPKEDKSSIGNFNVIFLVFPNFLGFPNCFYFSIFLSVNRQKVTGIKWSFYNLLKRGYPCSDENLIERLLSEKLFSQHQSSPCLRHNLLSTLFFILTLFSSLLNVDSGLYSCGSAVVVPGPLAPFNPYKDPLVIGWKI
jgi:hypothetical protein